MTSLLGGSMNNWLEAFRQSFSPLRIRNFRIYLGGQAISLVGTWLQMTAQGIVVYELSQGAATPLGIVGMLSTLPILILSPWTGVWADRLDRRRLLIGTQVGAMLLAFSLAVLTQTGLIQLWHVYVLASLLGIFSAIDFPAQQAFIGDLSGMTEVRKAVNLNGITLQASRMLGPALAGYMIGALGAASAFWLNGLSFMAVI
ncbi:MAG TPA: MFS transporter, partial [Anaerolineae bacterium]|nr:MFS transporter [Anaerolineae bacterium]